MALTLADASSSSLATRARRRLDGCGRFPTRPDKCLRQLQVLGPLGAEPAADAESVGSPTPAARAPLGDSLAKGERVALRIDDTDIEAHPPRPPRIGRFGPVFGDAVHEALGLLLVEGIDPRAAVERAANYVRLADHHAEAVEDVERALAALRAERLLDDRLLRIEYPVAAPRDGHILSGYIDLVSAAAGDVAVIDFKTDRWPRAIDAVTDAFPAYSRR